MIDVGVRQVLNVLDIHISTTRHRINSIIEELGKEPNLNLKYKHHDNNIVAVSKTENFWSYEVYLLKIFKPFTFLSKKLIK